MEEIYGGIHIPFLTLYVIAPSILLGWGLYELHRLSREHRKEHPPLTKDQEKRRLRQEFRAYENYLNDIITQASQY